MKEEEKEGYHKCIGCEQWVAEDHAECLSEYQYWQKEGEWNAENL